jgi:hypothetical protein
MPRLTPQRISAMLARVTSDLASEKDEGGASDLRILKMRLETAIALAEQQGTPITSERAPPGVTVH